MGEIKNMKNNAPFKYDIVGSFLRPDYLKQSREEYAKWKNYS